MPKLTIPEEEYMLPGHVGCLGCGATQTMRYVLKALGPRTIINIPACCWAVMPGPFPLTCLKIPLLNNAFETTAATASGIRAGLDALGKENINVVGFAGDGGTADIGIQALSGMVERQTDAFYIMYDNEAYMNTGIQRSGSTPMGAWTTTTPVGTTQDWKREPKKNMMEIMVAHDIPYAATASSAYPEDLIKKIRKGMKIKGSKFYQIYSSCPTGWRHPPEKGVEIARMATRSNIFPLYEVENGVYTINQKPKERLPIIEYFKAQGRYRHLPPEVVDIIQKEVDETWRRLVAKEEFTHKLAEGSE